MKNLPFVIWMVGAPIGEAFSQYVNEYLCGHTYSDIVTGLAAITVAVIYFYVGYMLYEKADQ